MRSGVWIRTLDTWSEFQLRARRYWWLWLLLVLVSQFLSARLSTATDWIVTQMNAPGVLADAAHQLVAPAGLVFIVVLVLAVHAYWDTRPSRSRSGFQISGTGTVSAPTDTFAMRVTELEGQLAAERAKSLQLETAHAQRASGAGLAPHSKPTVAEVKERADWIMAHPGLNPARTMFPDLFGPHEAWEQANKQLTAERRDSEAIPRHELAAVGRKATCTCGQTFATGPEFAAHQREGS